MTTTTALLHVELTDITTGPNVRGDDLGDVKGLADSIASVGLLNPLTVRLHDDGTMELVAGFRRYAALQRLGDDGPDRIAVSVLDAADDGGRLTAQLVENLQREDLTPVAEARGLAELVELVGGKRAAAAAVGRSAGHVSKRLALLQLPEPMQTEIEAGNLGPADGYDLARLTDTTTRRRLATRLLEANQAGHGAGYVRNEITRAIRDEAADAQLRKVARRLNRERGDGPEIVSAADVGNGKAGRYLDGWQGLPVDYDQHQAEHCHRRVLVSLTPDGDPDRWRDLCLEPGRHTENGASPVKLIAEDEEAADRLRRERLRHERKREDAIRHHEHATKLEALRLAAKGLTRSTALDTLTASMLGLLQDELSGDGELFTFLADLVGAPLPASDHPDDEDGVAWDQLGAWLESLEGAKAWRAAAGVALYWSALYPWHGGNEAVLAAASYVAPPELTDDEREAIADAATTDTETDDDTEDTTA